MSELVPYKKFAIGYDRVDGKSFTAMIEPYLSTIKEVYFSWPGMISGRALKNEKNFDREKEILLTDLTWCRNHGIGLDLLFNAYCYGENAFGEKLRYQVYDVIEELKDNGLFPEVVTTTSQYIAKVINVILDNKSFPDNWFESKIAQNYAINCTECGKCDEVLKKILKEPVISRPIYSFVKNKI